MSIAYNIYTNDGHGGIVDYSHPLATTADLTLVVAPLEPSSDTLFAVRAIDLTSGIEEANTDAQVRIILDADGHDITLQPNQPHALFVRALAGGNCRATWAYNPLGQRAGPLGFHVYLHQGTTPDYASPSRTIPYSAGNPWYSCNLSGLADGMTYTIAVRAYTAETIEQNTSVLAAVVGKSTPPLDVDNLSGTPTYKR